MLKKIISLLVIFAMLAPLSSAVAADEPTSQPTIDEILNEYHAGSLVSADTELSAESTELIVHDEENNRLIDELFALRCKLEVNFEENIDTIQQIDCRLAELGVENVSQDELLHSIGYDALPAANLDTSDENTQWTSRRTIVTFRGQHYEIQTFEGIPKNKNSFLRSNKVEVRCEAQRITAGTTEIVGILGITALGAAAIPEFAAAVTLMDIASSVTGALVENLQPTTVIDAVDGIALVSISSHMKIIFVKGYGSPDSYQKLGYAGNYSTCTISTLIVEDSEMGEHGSTAVHDATLNLTTTVQSAYFYDYTIAVQNYYNYYNNPNEPYVCEYTVWNITLNLLGQERNFAVPNGIPSVSF